MPIKKTTSADFPAEVLRCVRSFGTHLIIKKNYVCSRKPQDA